MKLTEKLNLFVEHIAYKKGGEEKTFHKLTTSIATKQEDGTFLRMPVDIFANAKRYPDAVLAKLDSKFMYTINIKNGWLVVDDYTNKDGKQIKKLCIYVDEMKIESKTAIDQEKREKALESAKSNQTGEDNEFPF